MEQEYLLFVLLACGASIISAVFGLGTALIVLAVGSHIIPAKEAITLGAVLFTASTALKAALFRKHINWKITGIMATTSLPFAYLGASLLTELPSDVLRRLLGIMILLYLALSVFKLLPNVKISTAGLIAGSASYGFVSGLLGSGNLIKTIIFREMSFSKEAFVGAMAATSVLSNIGKVTAYTNSGLLNANHFWPITGLVLGAVAAVFVGRYFIRKLDTSYFEMGVQTVLGISALALLI